jgi:hypothetical protein
LTNDQNATEHSDPPKVGVISPWNYRQLLLALGIVFILETVILYEFTVLGDAIVEVWLIFGLLYLVRVAWARWRRETGRGWIFYAVLMWTSPAWLRVGLWIHDRSMFS